MNEVDERILLRRIIGKDESALAELYERYSRYVFGLALHVLQDQALAEEATQDTFLKVWHNAERWSSERGSLKTWILTIARYTAVDRLRREMRQSPRSAMELEDILYLIADTTADDTAWADNHLLHSLIQQLPRDQIEVLELAFFKGMSHTEISEATNTPLGTIKSRIRAGLQTLRGMWLRSDS